jgi:hypothetical protein
MSDSSSHLPLSPDLSRSPTSPAPAVHWGKNHHSKNYKLTNDAEATLVGLISSLLLSSLKSSKVLNATKKSNLYAAVVTHPTPPAVHKLNNGIPLSMNHKIFIAKQWHSIMFLHLITRIHTHYLMASTLSRWRAPTSKRKNLLLTSLF